MNNRDKILDIAMNLNRIGNWAADGYDAKKKRIITFLDQTKEYMDSLEDSKIPDTVKKTFNQFSKEYEKLDKEGRKKPKDELLWAEKMMTWGNILTHRSKFL